MSKGWTGVDLDGTLAHYEGWDGGKIGKPIKPMVERVRRWILDGKEVRIFTARVSAKNQSVEEVFKQRHLIENWCIEVLGVALPVTCEKDYMMIDLWDDRCHQVESNTGKDLLEDALAWKEIYGDRLVQFESRTPDLGKVRESQPSAKSEPRGDARKFMDDLWAAFTAQRGVEEVKVLALIEAHDAALIAKHDRDVRERVIKAITDKGARDMDQEGHQYLIVYEDDLDALKEES